MIFLFIINHHINLKVLTRHIYIFIICMDNVGVSFICLFLCHALITQPIEMKFCIQFVRGTEKGHGVILIQKKNVLEVYQNF